MFKNQSLFSCTKDLLKVINSSYPRQQGGGLGNCHHPNHRNVVTKNWRIHPNAAFVGKNHRLLGGFSRGCSSLARLITTGYSTWFLFGTTIQVWPDPRSRPSLYRMPRRRGWRWWKSQTWDEFINVSYVLCLDLLKEKSGKYIDKNTHQKKTYLYLYIYSLYRFPSPSGFSIGKDCSLSSEHLCRRGA